MKKQILIKKNKNKRQLLPRFRRRGYPHQRLDEEQLLTQLETNIAYDNDYGTLITIKEVRKALVEWLTRHVELYEESTEAHFDKTVAIKKI